MIQFLGESSDTFIGKAASAGWREVMAVFGPLDGAVERGII